MIRAFERTDQDRVFDLIRDGLKERFGFYDDSYNEDIKNIWDNYIALGSKFYLLEQNGELIAVGGYKEIGEREAEIVRISVDSKHRRRGYARELLKFLEGRAYLDGYEKICLKTEHGWNDAQRLYKSLGYSQYDEDDIDLFFSKSIDSLKLNTFVLRRESADRFARYHAIYNHQRFNIWFPTAITRSIEVFKNFETPFSVYIGDKLVSMLVIGKARVVTCPFLIPPYSDYSLIVDGLLEELKTLMEEGNLKVLFVPEALKPYYVRAGYLESSTDAYMIRPVDKIPYSLPEGFFFEKIDPEEPERVAQLLREVYRESPIESMRNTSYEKLLSFVLGYLPEAIEGASLYIKSPEGALAGVIVTHIWEELPYIADIVVKREYSGKGLGTALIAEAMSKLGDYMAVRLHFVPGNKAQRLYSRLGFDKGVSISDMVEGGTNNDFTTSNH